MKYIKARQTSIIIPDYEMDSDINFERMLSVWNPNYFRFEPIGYHYNEKTKELIIPRGLDLSYLERQFNLPVDIEFKPDESEQAVYKLKKEPRNDIQRKSISYLMGEMDFNYTKRYSQLTLNLDTGDGKTYCVIAALTFMKTKSLIVTHTDRIKKQWLNSFIEMTDLDERYICDIKGSAVIDAILKKEDLRYKVYLVNHQTIHSYAKKNGWESITELFKKLKIGVKVFDEAHLEFSNMVKIDLFSNTKKTIYLTANFERSDFKENKLFNLCFKNIAKYGIETRDEKRKHIVYLAVVYNSKPNIDEQASMVGLHGFDKNRYVDYQVGKEIFFKVINYVMDYFKNKEGKILIFSTKIQSTKIIKDYLIESFPEKTVGIYNSEMSEVEKTISLSSDIISTTIKSAGTGFDIPGLRVCINTEPYSSKITANQTSGRLREYGPNEYTFYVELVDKGFGKVYKMYKSRCKIFKDKCAKVLELEYKNSN